MPRFVVSLRRLNPESWCCGAKRSNVRTTECGTEYDEGPHSPRCRVGRVLSGPMPQTVPGYEIAPVDDRRTVRSPR